MIDKTSIASDPSARQSKSLCLEKLLSASTNPIFNGVNNLFSPTEKVSGKKLMKGIFCAPA